MEEVLGNTALLLILLSIPLWIISGLGGAAWLMYKGYTLEMMGCLGALPGIPFVLMMVLGPLMLVFAWALPSKTDPSQEGGLKKIFKPRQVRTIAPKSHIEVPSSRNTPARIPSPRRPVLPDRNKNHQRKLPSDSGTRPKPPPSRR